MYRNSSNCCPTHPSPTVPDHGVTGSRTGPLFKSSSPHIPSSLATDMLAWLWPRVLLTIPISRSTNHAVDSGASALTLTWRFTCAHPRSADLMHGKARLGQSNGKLPIPIAYRQHGRL